LFVAERLDRHSVDSRARKANRWRDAGSSGGGYDRISRLISRSPAAARITVSANRPRESSVGITVTTIDGVGLDVGVGVDVAAAVAILVGVNVGVSVGVGVGVFVGVGVGVGVGVAVGVGVTVGVLVGV
jgi:hypothetical protein